jgi:hypothetical protein
VRFEAGPHSYHVDGAKVGLSVTGLVSAFFPGFNAKERAAGMLAKAHFPAASDYAAYHHLALRDPATGAPLATAVDTICAHWRAGSGSAAAAGTAMHDTLGLRCSWAGAGGVAPCPPSATPEEVQFAAYAAQRAAEGWVPYRTEQRVFDGPHQLAGAVDMQWARADGECDPEGRRIVLLADWKRTDKLHKRFGGERGYGPLGSLLACAESKYSLQLGLYRWMLEAHYNVHVVACEVVAMHPDLKERALVEGALVITPAVKADVFAVTLPRASVDAVMTVRAAQLREGETFYQLKARLAREGGAPRRRGQ